VTAIVTTAFGFALIISSVAGSTFTSGAQKSDSLGAITGHTVYYTQPYQTLAADKDASPQCVAWNDPCEIEL
jgi:hypothetical protein